MRIDRYEVKSELGRGGMGVVYLAHDPALGRDVALKILSPAAADEQARFAREAEALARLAHPQLVPILEAGTHKDRPFIVMQLLEGVSLRERLRRGPLDPTEAARICLALAEGLQHAHDRDVLHRDVKPENVILLPSGQPVLTDFGLARPLQDRQRLTATGEILGTPAFMAPEQVAGERDLTPAVDVYGLGATLYELLCGQPPFKAPTMINVLAQVLDQLPVPPSKLRAGIDPRLEAICLRCLEKPPQQRYASAADLSTALVGWLDPAPVPRSTSRAPLAAAGAIVCGGLIAGLVVVSRRGSVEPPVARVSASTSDEGGVAPTLPKPSTSTSASTSASRFEGSIPEIRNLNRARKYEAALDRCAEAEREDPPHETLAFYEVWALEYLDRGEEADRRIATLLADPHRHRGALAARGQVRVYRHQLQPALEDLLEARRLGYDAYELNYMLFQAARELSKLDLATEAGERMAELERPGPELLQQLATLAWEAGQATRAEGWARRRLEQDRNDRIAQFGLGYYSLLAGRTEEGCAQLEALAKVWPVCRSEVQIVLARHDPDPRVLPGVVDELIQAGDARPEWRREAAETLLAGGHASQAARLLDWRQTLLRGLWLRTEIALGNHRRAWDLLEKIDVEATLDIEDQLAVVELLAAEGRHAKALEAASALSPGTLRPTGAWVAEARQLRALGRFEQAERSLRHILATCQPPEALLELGQLLAEVGRDAEAEAQLRRAVELEPWLLEGWLELRDVRRRLGDRGGLEVAVSRASALAGQGHWRAYADWLFHSPMSRGWAAQADKYLRELDQLGRPLWLRRLEPMFAAWRKGDLVSWVRPGREYLQVRPTDTFTARLVVRSCLELRRPELAKGALRTVREGRGGYLPPTLRPYLIRALAESDRAAAQHEIARWAESEPGCGPALEAWALSTDPASTSEDWARALKWVESADHARPEAVDLPYLRAELLAKLGRYDEARQALESLPEQVDRKLAGLLRVELLLRAGELERAQAEAERLVAGRCFQVKAWILLGKVARAREDTDLLRVAMEGGQRLTPDRNAFIELHLKYLMHLERIEEALVVATEHRQRAPDELAWLRWCGFFERLAGRPDRALELFRQAPTEQQTDPSLGYDLAQVLVELDRVEDASRVLEQLAGRVGANSWRLDEIRALVHAKQGQGAEAERLLGALEGRLEPDELAFARGRAQAYLGRRPQARALIEEALELAQRRGRKPGRLLEIKRWLANLSE